MGIKINEKTKELIDKRSRVSREKEEQIALIDLYKKTFRRVENYYNDYKNKREYCPDIDIEEDLFDSDEDDDDDDK